MTEVKPDYSTNYWETVAKQERQKAEANLRLAAERATTIQELSDELRAAKAEIERLKGITSELPGLLRRWALADTTEQAYAIEDYINRKLKGGEG